MARYAQAFKDRTVARLLPLRSASLDLVVQDVGVEAGTLERSREECAVHACQRRAWAAGARFEAVTTTAAINEAGKSAWCNDHRVYPAGLHEWRASYQ